MGCFSYLCSECGDPINSDSTTGENCILFLMIKGVTQEVMAGQYNSYGRVFTGEADGSDQDWETMEWGDIVGLHFNDKKSDSGIAAYHRNCYKGGPPEVSEDDIEQGWGEYKKTKNGKFEHLILPRIET